MKRYLITYFVIVISILGVYPIFAQEKQKIPKDFFMGKWGGNISGVIAMGEIVLPFNLELSGHPGKNTALLKLVGKKLVSEYDDGLTDITITDPNAICAIYSEISPPVFTINFSQGVSFFNTMSVYQLAFVTGFKVEIRNDNLLSLNAIKEALAWKNGGNAKGELHRIYIKKDTLGKTVHINDPIKTDEFTQRDIVIPAISDFPFKIGELIVAGNTECVFTSKNELHLISGEVISFVDKNWWERVDLDKIISSEPEISDIDFGEITTKLDKLREARI